MAQNNTVILAGGSELTAAANVSALESAGYLVVSANNLDYALAASELFKPKTLLLDADAMIGDIELFCLTLIYRPQPPMVFILGSEKKARFGGLLKMERVEYFQKPVPMSFLMECIEFPPRVRPPSLTWRRKRLAATILTGAAAAAVAIAMIMSAFIRNTADGSSSIIEDAQVPLAEQAHGDDSGVGDDENCETESEIEDVVHKTDEP